MLSKGIVSVNIHRKQRERSILIFPKPIQREVLTKEQKQDDSHSKKKGSTKIKNLKAKP